MMNIDNPVIYVPIRHLASGHFPLPSTSVEEPLQIGHIFQNKANLLEYSNERKFCCNKEL